MKNKILLFVVCLVIVITPFSSKAQAPIASFSFTSAVCAGYSVQIVDGSSNTPTSWSYTVVGVGTYTTQNPVVTFPTTGTFFISLIASNGTGPSLPNTQSIVVNNPPTVTATAPTSICTGDYVALAGNGALTYTWTGGVIDGSAFLPASSATYTVTGFDNLGCYNTATTSVTLKPLPTISISGFSTVCIGSAITLTANGGNTYTWSAGPTGSVLTNTPTGNTTFTVAGTSAVTNCSNFATKSITVNALPTITVNSGTVCAGNIFTMTPGGGVSYVYSNGQNTVIPTGNSSYTVTGFNGNGCSNTAVADVTVYSRPSVGVNSGTMCSGTIFTLNPTGGVSYSINSPGNSTTVSPLTSTNYAVYSINSNGCLSATAAIANVSVTAAPVLTVNSGTICVGSVFTINPQGANVYTYITGGSTVSPLTTTSYSIIGQNTVTGCVSAEAIVTVTVYALPSVSVNNGTVCAGDVFTMNPSGINATSFIYSSITNTVIPTGNTSYSVTGVSAQGCLSPTQAIASVTVYAKPTISVTSGSVCQGSAYTMTASGGFSYNFSSGSATVFPNVNSIVLVTGVSQEGCPSANTATATITVFPLPTLSVTLPAGVCLGDTATLTVSGASTYTWISDNTQATTFTAAPTANTVYTVAGTNSNGCVNTKTVMLSVFALPTITVNSGAVCPGGSFVMIPGGGVSYTFSSGSPVVTPVANSTYSVIGTDANGCISPVPAISTVNIVNSLTISVAGNTTICEGASTTLSVSGAGTYSWSTNAVTNTVSLNPTSTTGYSVVGYSGSCSDTLELSVLVHPAPDLTLTSSAVILCIGDTAVITTEGAASYTWEGLTSTDATIAVSPTVATNYTVTGLSVNSCSATAVITQSVQDCTGLEKISKSNALVNVYPNPNNGTFTIHIDDQASLKVLDIMGKEIYSTRLIEHNTDIDIKNH
ncbi:MAG: hypothetical protein JNL60_16415, partial [Bacteroidia bacterium]|nr:hypothetical protein [Bacteroidia bacterium]